MKDILIKTRNRFAAAALGCMVFAAVYECFSHGVFSPFMLLAFLFPLLMGAVPCTVLADRPGAGVPSLYLYTSGVAALTAGSLFQGILEIYGTTSRLSGVFWAVGLLLSMGGALLYLLERAEALRSRS